MPLYMNNRYMGNLKPMARKNGICPLTILIHEIWVLIGSLCEKSLYFLPMWLVIVGSIEPTV